MESITPAQQRSLDAWAKERDNLLMEISALEFERDKKKKVNENLNQSNIDLEIRLNILTSKIEEAEKNEKEKINFIPKELSDLENQKSTLFSEVNSLKQVVVSLISKKNNLMSDIDFLIKMHDNVFQKTNNLEEKIDNIKNTSHDSVLEIQSALEVLKKTTQEIVEVNKKNVSEAMIIIDKLPRAILEYRRPVIPNKTIISKRSPINLEQ